VRKTFIENLRKRFTLMESDIESLLKEEKKFSEIPKEPLKISEVLMNLSVDTKAPIKKQAADGELPVLSNLASLKEAFAHLFELVMRNSAQAPVSISLDQGGGPAPDIFIALTIEDAAKPLLPDGLSQQMTDPNLAWTALLEPFVGVDDFAHHSTGLRVQTARIVRMLSAVGGRSEFQVSNGGRRVELLVSFKANLN